MKRFLTALVGLIAIFCVMIMTLHQKEIQVKQLNSKINQLEYNNQTLVRKVYTEQLKKDEIQIQLHVLKQKRFLTYQDIKALEKITEAEAGNQSIEGKAGVASVILNRWNNSKNMSAKQIIMRKGQFSSVPNGMYSNAISTEETKQAVQMALYKDYANGAEYFLNPRLSDKSSILWFNRELELVSRSGNHEFYKRRK